MSNRELFTCPMCNGESKVSVLTFREDTKAPHRIAAYALVVFAVLIGGTFLNRSMAPREPTALEQCSQSCGAPRFQRYTQETPAWVERMKGADPDINHAPVPAKCECVVVEPK